MFRRRRSPAARSEGRESFRGLRGFECTTCRGSWWSEEEIPTRARGGGGETNNDDGAPAVDVGRKPAHELQ
jgi:hypothetical protein